jgi:hypothetical protein
MLLRRLARYITATALYRYLLAHARAFAAGLAGLGLLALAAIALWSFVIRQPPPLASTQALALETRTAQRQLDDAEAALQLAFVRSAVAAKSGAAYTDLVDQLAERLQREHVPTGQGARAGELGPLFDQLSLQLANGDPLAEETLGQLIALLREPPSEADAQP